MVQNVVPTVIPAIDSTTVTLPNSTWNYLEVTIDDNKPFAFITMEYFVGDICIAGGTEDTEALIDYSSRPYFVGSLNGMFSNNRKIRYDLTKWNVNPVTNMRTTFFNNIKFNQEIGNWDVSNTNMFRQAFSGATSFNKPLSNWNVSKSTDFMGCLQVPHHLIRILILGMSEHVSISQRCSKVQHHLISLYQTGTCPRLF